MLSSNKMIKIVYRVVVKPNRIEEFQRLATTVLVLEAKKLKGCKLFSIFQSLDEPKEFIFYELWERENDIHSYKDRLIEILGNPNPGEEFPAHLSDFFEEDEDII